MDRIGTTDDTGRRWLTTTSRRNIRLEIVKVDGAGADALDVKLLRQLALALAVAAPIASIDATVAVAHTSTAAPAAPSGTTYTVRAGDGLASIARKVGVQLADLLAANQLTTSSTIHPGQVLAVPIGGNSSPSQPNPTAQPPSPAGTTPYTVKAGDSLFVIARRNGVTLNSLLNANSFTITSTILPGQVIRIPAATQPAATPAASPTDTASLPTTTPIETLVKYLRQQVGKPYTFFTAGPDTFDCSGLVVAAYRQIGIALPHQSRMQSSIGTAVGWRSQPIQAGDLIFMVSSVEPTRIGHVGIALGDGTWIQAVATGIPVRIRAIPSVDKISAVRRIVTA